MKKLLTVSFVALISVISAGNAAIPDKKYVDDTVAQKVDRADVAEKGETVADANSDKMVPSVARMEAAITDATENIDMSSKVNVAQSVKGGVLTTNADTGQVEVATVIAQDKVDGLTDALGAKVDKTSIITKTGHTYEEIAAKDVAEQDTLVPSFAIMNDMGIGLRDKIVENISDIESNAGEIKSLKTMVSDNATDIAGKVDKSQVIATGGTVTSADTEIPTIARMEAAITDATGNIDMSSKVNVAQSVKGGVLTTNADTGQVEVATVIAQDKVDGLTDALDSKVNKAQGEENKNAIMITDATGNVIPALVGACANTANKCALVTGADESGNLVLQWEVIARNVSVASTQE